MATAEPTEPNGVDELVRTRAEELRRDPVHQAKVAKIRRDMANGSLAGKRMNRDDVERLQEQILRSQ